MTEAVAPPLSGWWWVAFSIIIATVMALDLGLFHRKARKVSTREAAIWVSVWVSLALLFNAGLWFQHGRQGALEFLTGYVVEICLSVDNLFVFVVIFTYFNVRPEHQHRVLFWGILGAIVTRMGFIFLGFWILETLGWLIYVFGAFLVYTGFKLLKEESKVEPEKNVVLRVARKLLPITRDYHAERFFVKEAPASLAMETATTDPPPARKARWAATPLFLVLLVIETTDIVFAVDSVPAILGVTRDRFIAFTSNIFAILGLRSMYFVLIGILDKFHFLRFGLSFVLVFIGLKMLFHSQIDGWFEDKSHPALISLAIVMAILASSILLSLVFPPRRRPLEP